MPEISAVVESLVNLPINVSGNCISVEITHTLSLTQCLRSEQGFTHITS